MVEFVESRRTRRFRGAMALGLMFLLVASVLTPVIAYGASSSNGSPVPADTASESDGDANELPPTALTSAPASPHRAAQIYSPATTEAAAPAPIDTDEGTASRAPPASAAVSDSLACSNGPEAADSATCIPRTAPTDSSALFDSAVRTSVNRHSPTRSPGECSALSQDGACPAPSSPADGPSGHEPTGDTASDALDSEDETPNGLTSTPRPTDATELISGPATIDAMTAALGYAWRQAASRAPPASHPFTSFATRSEGSEHTEVATCVPPLAPIDSSAPFDCPIPTVALPLSSDRRSPAASDDDPFPLSGGGGCSPPLPGSGPFECFFDTSSSTCGGLARAPPM
jgi:hypothetical protein